MGITWWKQPHFLLLGIALFWPTIARASEIQGVVTDPLGAVIRNARVELVTHKVIVGSAQTDSEGNYRVEVRQPGRMHLHVEAPTFAAQDTAEFYLGGGKETLTRNVFLRLNNVREEVVVTATGVPVSEAQVGAPVDVLSPSDLLNHLDILQALPSVPGLEVTQTGERGGT